jgi:hypothetical protein
MDIEEFLDKHKERIDRIAWHYAKKYKVSRNPDDVDEIRDAIETLLYDRHMSPAYDHSKHDLWTYVQPALEIAVFEALNPYRHLDDGMDFQGNPVYVEVVPHHEDDDDDSIRSIEYLEQNKQLHNGHIQPRQDDDPITVNWFHAGRGEQISSLTPEELELAQKIAARLTDEELALLDASVGRTEPRAAESLGLPRSTYRYRLMHAREKAQSLARLIAS